MQHQVNVLWIARYDYLSEWKLKKHNHNFYQMIYIIEGEGNFFIEKEEYEIKNNTLFMLKPCQMHGLIVNKGKTVKTIDIKFKVNNDLLSQMLDNLNNIYTEHFEAKLLLEKIKEEGKQRKPFFKDLTALHLLEIILKLVRQEENNKKFEIKDITNLFNFQNKDKKATVIEKYIKYIEDNFQEDLSLDKISHEIGYHPSYICQKFRESVNTTPISFLYRYRIEKAKEYISYSSNSLKEISLMVGFKNIHHFTRCFRRYVGLTPGKWLKNERKGIRKDIYISEEFVNIDFTEKNA